MRFINTITIMLSLFIISCSNEPEQEIINKDKYSIKQFDSSGSYYCPDEDKYGNCIDGGAPLPEIIIRVPAGDHYHNIYPGDIISFPNPNEGGAVDGGVPSQDNLIVGKHLKAIMNEDNGVMNQLDTIFIKTKESLSKEKGRREMGAWIFYDEESDKYIIGALKYGKYIKGDKGTYASIVLGGASPKGNSDDEIKIPKTAVAVAAFHTHTALSNLKPRYSREVGFSPSDIKYSNDNNIPIILIDYIGTEGNDGRFYINGGHDIDSPSKFYIHYPNK